MTQRNILVAKRRVVRRSPSAAILEGVASSGCQNLDLKWNWYWKNELEQWIEYGNHGGKGKGTLTSADLEMKYLADNTTVVPFQAGDQQYEINFQDMTQRNLLYGTKREICRRPRVISPMDMSSSGCQNLDSEWAWYWKNELGEWIEYGNHGGKEKGTLTSADLEMKYLADKTAVVPFQAGAQQYEINFQDMTQRNLLFGTKREVSRRPRVRPLKDVASSGCQNLDSEWAWYWKNDLGQCKEYGNHGGSNKAIPTSADLEMKYQADNTAVVTFQAGAQRYEINFQDMTQKNVLFGTKREVRRRPRAMSLEEVERSWCHQMEDTSLARSMMLGISLLQIEQPMEVDPPQECSSPRNSSFNPVCSQPLHKKRRIQDDLPEIKKVKTTETIIPANWDETAVPDVGYQLVDVTKNSTEFREVQSYFEKTMTMFSIQKIKRIQNLTLWQAYQLKMEQMKTANQCKNVLEKKLFHGTKASLVDTICHNNLDWRICGVNGTVYGKGSYFARDALYSHCYCRSSSSSNTMFLARVLVGDFVEGQNNYVRPPPKPTSEINLYDSCVDNEHNPSIFVIFDAHQIYPEYILEYT